MADGEIPVILRPEGFDKTKQQSDDAARSIEKLGQLGQELARRFGPGVVIFKELEFIARQVETALDHSLGGVTDRAKAAADAIIGMRDAVRSTVVASNNSAVTSGAGQAGTLASAIGRPALLAQGGAPADPRQAAKLAGAYGTTLNDVLAAQATGANLDTANLVRLKTGGSLADAAKQVAALGPGASRGDPSLVAATVLNRSAQSPGDLVTPGSLTAAKARADADPYVQAARKDAGVLAEKELKERSRDVNLAPGERGAQARSPEVQAALERAQTANREVGAFPQRETQMAREYGAGGFWARLYNYRSFAGGLGELDFEQRTKNAGADAATVEAIKLLRSTTLKTRPVIRDAAAQ